MTNIVIKDVQVTGTLNVSEFAVLAVDSAGREYCFWDTEMRYVKAVAVAQGVKRRGTINPDFWICRVPYGVVAWELDGLELRQVEDEFYAC